MLGQEPKSHRIFKRLAKALISLRVCAGWSEPLLVAHTTLLEISHHGSIMILKLMINVSRILYAVLFFIGNESIIVIVLQARDMCPE